MQMTAAVAQMRITRDLRDAEAAVQNALYRQVTLLKTMLEAKEGTGAGAFDGHNEIVRLVKAQQNILSAGGDLARVHGGLSDIAVEKGILEPCPPNEPMGLNSVDERHAA